MESRPSLSCVYVRLCVCLKVIKQDLYCRHSDLRVVESVEKWIQNRLQMVKQNSYINYFVGNVAFIGIEDDNVNNLERSTAQNRKYRN